MCLLLLNSDKGQKEVRQQTATNSLVDSQADEDDRNRNDAIASTDPVSIERLCRLLREPEQKDFSSDMPQSSVYLE